MPTETPPNMETRRGDPQGTPRRQDASFTPTSTRQWLPPEAPQFPGVGEGADLPKECVCLCHHAHGSSPRTPWPQGTLCQLSLLSWASFSSAQSCFAPAVQDRQTPRPLPVSSVGTRAGTDLAVARATGRRAGPPCREERLCAAPSLLRLSPPAGFPSSCSLTLKLPVSLQSPD